MKFELATFNATLDPLLVEKGKKWHSGGMVHHVKNTNECVWDADFIGPTKHYKLQLEIVGKEVQHFFCACGPKLCGHVVAFLFELTEKKYPTQKYHAETERNSAQKAVNSPLSKILQNIIIDDLKDFIEDYAKDNKEFQELFLREFGEIDIESHVAKFTKVIKSTLKYNYESDAVDGTRKVLKEAEKNFKNENYEVAFAGCKAVLTEWAQYVGSMKQAGYVFSDALKQLHVLVLCEDLSESLKASILSYIYQLYKSSDIEDYQDGEFWTDAFTLLSTSTAQLEKVIALIDWKLAKTSQTYKSRLLEHRHTIEEAIKKNK